MAGKRKTRALQPIHGEASDKYDDACWQRQLKEE